MGVKKIGRYRRDLLIGQLLFADDVALVVESAEQLHSSATDFGSVGQRTKVRVKVEKSKVVGKDGVAT